MPNTPVPAAGEAMPAANINRRLAMLGGLTATAAALTMPPNSSKAEEFGASALGPKPQTPTVLPTRESQIMALFRQWEQAWHSAGTDDDEVNALFMDRARAIEDAMMKLPAATGPEFAAKMIVHTGYCGFEVDENSTLYQEALALTGATHGGAPFEEGNL